MKRRLTVAGWLFVAGNALTWTAVFILLSGLAGCASEPQPRPTTYTCGDPHYYHPLCEIGR